MALRLNSLAEAYLYLMVQRCAGCGLGPVVAAPQSEDSKLEISNIATRCKACGEEGVVELDLSEALEERPRLWNEIPVGEPGGMAVPINATEKPSAVIDVAEWLTLSSMIAEAARGLETQVETTADRGLVRQLNVQAGRCLDEAMKFYLDGEELPPAKAFFGNGSRQQFHERPELFARTRLIGMRAKLPMAR